MTSGSKAADGPHPRVLGQVLRHDVDGIVLLDKPLGLSSNQALQRVKRLFNARKAGHTGSLDPLASGILPICLGQATKISTYLLNSDKVYRVTVLFGVGTATGDAEGAITCRGAGSVSEAELERVLDGFRGTVSQVPPMYSALKRGGRPLYELAREGKEVSREPRLVTIHELAVETYHPRTPVLRVRCSKGTYIRTLVEDLAAAAGTVAHVAALRRLSVGPFAEAAMRRFQDIEAAREAGRDALERLLVHADNALPHYPGVSLEGPEAIRIRQGQVVRNESLGGAPGIVRLYGEGGQFLGVGERLADGRIVPRRLMVASESGREPQSGL